MENDKALTKLAMLKHAVDALHDSEPPEWEQELREGAWLILHNEPGTEREEWRQTLLTNYPTEIVDTFGTDPAEAYAKMDDWWESETYEDKTTGLCETYEQWSLIFANEKSKQVFDELASVNLKIRRLRLQNKFRR